MRKKILEEKGKDEYEEKKGKVSNVLLEEKEQIEDYLDEVRKARLIFKRTESCLEVLAQQTVQLAMLMLSRSNYPVAGSFWQRLLKSGE